MYKIQNMTGGALPINLEQGSTIIRAGGYLDLDGICSRKWIRKDPLLKKLINSGNVHVVWDSEGAVPRAPTGDIMGSAKALAKAKKLSRVIRPVKPEPVIIDLSHVPDELPIEDVVIEKEPVVVKEKAVPVVVAKKEEIVEPSFVDASAYTSTKEEVTEEVKVEEPSKVEEAPTEEKPKKKRKYTKRAKKDTEDKPKRKYTRKKRDKETTEESE